MLAFIKKIFTNIELCIRNKYNFTSHNNLKIVFSCLPIVWIFNMKTFNLIKLYFTCNFFFIFYVLFDFKVQLLTYIIHYFKIILNIYSNNDGFIFELIELNYLKIINESMFLSNTNYFFYLYENLLVLLNNCIYISKLKITNIILSLNLPIFIYFYFLYILTTIISLLLMSWLGLYGVFFLNLISIILFWFSSIIYFNSFFLDNFSCFLTLGKWFILNYNYIVHFSFYIDVISFSFMFLTLTIAVFVYIYAFSYFRYEPNVERLLLLINMFVLSMICLVISGNFFVLFLGWELIGLTSFFLINFWSTRISTVKSAFKAFVFNKISDVALLFVIILVFFCTNDININLFNFSISYYNNFYLYIYIYKLPLIEILSFFFLICAFIKSAQFGFHSWLPDSMEAPVPASALIHSATLVSAGVYLLLRFNTMFEYSVYSYYIIPLVGSFTAFFGGICSCYQTDIKRILAYSTISHCGFLMVTYSTYITEYTILYLYIHGFFKAAVFLCVGNVIRFNKNNQDFRTSGQYWLYLPFECFSSFICLINLSGLPFTIGFYIKHLLLIGIYLDNNLLYFILINILGGAIFGLIYSYRLFYYVFFDIKKAKKVLYCQANRINFNSKFYSNTTLASNIAILLLIIISYIISLYLLNICLNKTSLGEGLNIYSIYSSQYLEFNHPLLSIINNIGYFNWILICIILCICTMMWRIMFNSVLMYTQFFFINIFIILFIIFLKFLL